MTGSVMMDLKPAKRVVSKAFDGGAAINALLMKRMHADDFHRELTIAEGLLSYGLAQVDVQNISGLPHKVIAAAARKTEIETTRAGRRPVGMGRIFATPASHLRLSVFLGLIDRFVPGLKSNSQIVRGEELLAALKETAKICGPLSDRDVGVRYYLTAIHQLGSGVLILRQCGKCPVQYVRTRDSVRANGTVMLGGTCPYCQYLRGLKSKHSRMMTAPAQLEDHDAEVDESASEEDFDSATLKAEVSQEGQREALRELLA